MRYNGTLHKGDFGGWASETNRSGLIFQAIVMVFYG